MARTSILFLSLLLFSFFCFSQEKEKFMDFSFITPNQEKLNLSDIKTDYILLYFYSPECEDCTKIKRRLIKNENLNLLIGEKRITVLAILPDVEKEYWLDNLNFIPKNWLNGWNENDKTIISTYLKTVPTFFIIDKEMNIILSPDQKKLLKWLKTQSK